MKKLLTSKKPGWEWWSRWSEAGRFISAPFFLMTTLAYPKKGKKHVRLRYGSWRIDQMKVTVVGEMSESDQEAYCLKYLGKAFSKALALKRRVTSKRWSNLDKYDEYLHTQDVLDNMKLEYVTESQKDLVPEEALFLERKT